MIDASVLRARIRERMDEHVSGPVLMDGDAIRHGEDDEILALIDEIEMERIDAEAKEWAREYGPDYALLAAYQAEGR